MGKFIDMIPNAGKRDALGTCNVATYELGSVVRCLVYASAHHQP